MRESCFSSRANISVSMKPLIYVNAIRCSREFPPDFQGPPGALRQNIVSLSDAAQPRRRALAALDLVNHAHQGCMGSSEPGCPHAGHDPYAVRRHSRMCSHKPVERFDLRRRRPPSADDQGTNSPPQRAKTGSRAGVAVSIRDRADRVSDEVLRCLAPNLKKGGRYGFKQELLSRPGDDPRHACGESAGDPSRSDVPQTSTRRHRHRLCHQWIRRVFDQLPRCEELHDRTAPSHRW
jgi:hypothetical protein